MADFDGIRVAKFVVGFLFCFERGVLDKKVEVLRGDEWRCAPFARLMHFEVHETEESFFSLILDIFRPLDRSAFCWFLSATWP